MANKVPRIKPSVANRPRNAFDLSQRHLFTAPVGALLPVLSLDLMPHDHVEIQASDFMRTLPMNSAAFVSMRGVYEFFFVPYSQLWHPMDQFITGMTDYSSEVVSAVYGGKVPEKVPSSEVREINKYLSNLADKDIFGYPMKTNTYRLLDLLGYGRWTDVAGKPLNLDNINSVFVTPLRAAAYQKIYSDFYRNTTYEPVEVKAFNLDDLKGTISGKDFVERFCSLRYRNAQLDAYTNLRPRPLFHYAEDSLGVYFRKGNNLALDLSLNGSRSTVVMDPVIDAASDPLGKMDVSKIGVSDIRNAFALDKMLSITMRAGKTYAEQIKAHFGVDVSEGRDGSVSYLGGFDSNIQVGDVTQTSGTTSFDGLAGMSGYLGRVVGKGTASGSGKIRFDAKEHGILMCVYSVVPDMQYDSTRLDPFVTKQTRGDFFIPEFENLGMQPVSALGFTFKKASGYSYGWQPRYSEYKTALDVNHGQFNDDQPLSYWCIARARGDAAFDSFTLRSLKIDPSWVNTVFLVDYNGQESTDCLFGGCMFNIQKVSDMSEDGMPRV